MEELGGGGVGGGSWGRGRRRREELGEGEAEVCVGASSHVVFMCSSDVPQVGLSVIRPLS